VRSGTSSRRSNSTGRTKQRPGSTWRSPTPEQAEVPVDAHRLYTDATQFMRLSTSGPFYPANAVTGVKRRIAAAVGFPDFDAFAAVLGEARSACGPLSRRSSAARLRPARRDAPRRLDFFQRAATCLGDADDVGIHLAMIMQM
jgi:hypothetical protein